MARKVIPKKWLDKAIAGVREYWSISASEQVLKRTTDAATQIECATGIAWYALENLLNGILSRPGCKPDATNEDIYAILHLLGWEVSD